MAGVSVGVAYVDIAPKLAQGFAKNLETQIGPPAAGAAKQVESSFGGAFKNIAGIAAGTFAAVKITGFFKDSIAAARESNRVAAQTEAVIKSTGGVANVTAKQVDQLSNAIARKTGIDDEQIAAAADLLLTFTSIRNEVGKNNDVFNQATKIAVDMGAALGGDASSNAIQLGKALQDPAQGMLALRRAGVSFTAQQQDQIKAMQASGDLLGAQKAILAELTKEFGGSAAAQATAADRMKVAFGNLQEQIGNVLTPVIDGLAKALSGLVGWFSDAPVGIKAAAAAAAALAAGIVAVSVATKVWAAAQLALNVVMDANPVVLLGIAVAALVAGIVVAYKNSETFRDVVKGAFQATANAVGDAVGWILDYVDKLIGAWATAAEALSHIPGIGKEFAGVADVLRTAQHDVQGWADTLHKGIDITGDATGASDKHTDALKGEAAATTAVTDATKTLADSLKTTVTSMINPLKAFEKTAVEALGLSKVKEELNKGQEWEADYRKLSAAAKAGLEPAAQAAAKTVLSLGQLRVNLAQGIKDVAAWEADLKKIGERAGGQFKPLATELAKLGPDAAAAVHEAVGASNSTLGSLQGQFAERARLIADPTIQAFTELLLAAAPPIAAATTTALHDAFLAGSPVLSPLEAAAYFGIRPGVTPGVAGPPAPGYAAVPGVTPGVAGPPAPGKAIPGVTPGYAGPPAPGTVVPGVTPGYAGPPAPGTVVINVHPAANASSRDIAADLGDHVAWRLAPRPALAG